MYLIEKMRFLCLRLLKQSYSMDGVGIHFDYLAEFDFQIVDLVVRLV